MADKFFNRLDEVFQLMSQNKLRKDIDDTLFEKLLTFLHKCTCQPDILFNRTDILPESVKFDFMEELVRNTTVLSLVEKVNVSVAEGNENYFISIKTFSLRLLGLILENEKEIFSLENLLKYPIFKDENGAVIHHVPSIQDALLTCLSCITKHLQGALWFVHNNLKDFVFSNFYSSSYYVRKTAVNCFVNFIMQWAYFNEPELEGKKLEAEILQISIKSIMSHIVKNLCYFEDKKQMQFSECCIFVTKQVLEIENFENLIEEKLEKLAKDIAGCLTHLPEDNNFNNKMLDLFLSVHHKSKETDEFMTGVIKSFLIQEDIKNSFNLISSFANIEWPKSYSFKETTFFILPLYILTNAEKNDGCLFQVDFDLIYEKLVKKMENKSDCKFLISLAFSTLRNLVPLMNSVQKKELAVAVFQVVKCSDIPNHKWQHSVLQDRSVHHSLLELLSPFINTDAHQSFIENGSDLIFKIIIEFLKRPSFDSNFLSQLILLMKNLLVSHERIDFILNDIDKEILMEIVCRMLLDNRETIIDSSIQLTGQILCGKAWSSWTEKVTRHKVHSIIWDIAVVGSHDGSIKSTALKVIITGCLQEWCLNEIKSLKGVAEIDIVKILFDLTHNSDFFVQREALSSLFYWMKSKWTNLRQLSKEFYYCKEFFFSALVTAIKSLDLELKLTSLDAWLWIIENRVTISDSTQLSECMEFFTRSGFGLSLILGIEDYDEVIKYKSAVILFNLQCKFMRLGISEDSISIKIHEEPIKHHMVLEHLEPFTEGNRDEGIDNVMEISTTEQITNICRPPSLADTYDFREEYFTSDSNDRKCTVSLLWSHIWSKNLNSILHPEKPDIQTEIQSLLNDILASRVIDFELMEDTPDCY